MLIIIKLLLQIPLQVEVFTYLGDSLQHIHELWLTSCVLFSQVSLKKCCIVSANFVEQDFKNIVADAFKKS